MSLTIVRDGREKEVEVKLGELKDQAQAQVSKEGSEGKLGLKVKEITPEFVNRFNLDQDSGVIIVNVARGSSAYEAGFRSGDIIIDIDKNAISNIEDYNRAVNKIEKDKLALFLVKRGKNTYYIGYRIPEEEKEKN